MPSNVFMITDAYESGMGHGLAGDGMDIYKTPHGNPEHAEAYELGYNLGMSRRVLHNGEKAKRSKSKTTSSLWFRPSESQIEGIPDFIEISLENRALAALKIRRLFDGDPKGDLFVSIKDPAIVTGTDTFMTEDYDKATAAIVTAIDSHAPEVESDSNELEFIEELARSSYTGLTISKTGENKRDLQLVWHHQRTGSHPNLRRAIFEAHGLARL